MSLYKDLQKRAQILVNSLPHGYHSSEIISLLLDSGFTAQDLNCTVNELSDITNHDFDTRKYKAEEQERVFGPSSSEGESADITSAISWHSAHQLYLTFQHGRPNLMELAEVTSYGVFEREPFDIQCILLRTLLASPTSWPDRNQRTFDILSHICKCWWQGMVVYTQNSHEGHARMIFAWAFREIILQIHQKSLVPPSNKETRKLLSQEAPIVLTQIASRILVVEGAGKENDNLNPLIGSGVEVAVDLLTLLALSSFPWMDILKEDIESGIQIRRKILFDFIDAHETNSVPASCLSYAIAALRKDPATRLPSWSPDEYDHAGEAQNSKMTAKLTKFAEYFSNAEYMNGESLVSIKASVLEGSFYTELLQMSRSDIFPQTSSNEKDKYLEYIPPMFTFQITYFERCVAPQWLFDISLWSMFIFLVDEYMEKNVTNFSASELHDLKLGLERIHPDPNPEYSIIKVTQLPSVDGERDSAQSPPKGTASPRVDAALSLLYKWASWVLNWDRLGSASMVDMNDFRSEVKKYLLSHLHQIRDNSRLAAQVDQWPTSSLRDRRFGAENAVTCLKSPRKGYAAWLHTDGGGHISAPVSLAMATCYMGSWARKGKDGWSSVMQRMLAYELNIHVAAYCRIYNDYGSITRDTAECNLNSINFPEFWTGLTIATKTNATNTERDGLCVDADLQSKVYLTLKERLLELGQHERMMADDLAHKFFSSLEQEKSTTEGKIIASAMRVYFRSGELFSDMYLTRDVTNTVK